MEFQAIQKEIDFQIKVLLAPNEIYLENDEIKLMQLLINLISNALKFTQVGFVKLTVSMAYPNVLKFEVEDSGVGMDASIIAKVGEPF